MKNRNQIKLKIDNLNKLKKKSFKSKNDTMFVVYSFSIKHLEWVLDEDIKDMRRKENRPSNNKRRKS